MSTETELISLIKSNFQSIKENKSNVSKQKKILRRLRKIKTPSKSELRILAAQWIVFYHTLCISASETEKQMDASLKQTETDLKHALKLLDFNFQDKNILTEALFCKADIAQKLSLFPELDKTFNQITEISQGSPHLSMPLMSIAPSLANWSFLHERVSEYEKFLSGKNFLPSNQSIDMIEVLHQTAESGMPDLGVIYKLAKKNNLHLYKRPKVQDLIEETVKLTDIDLSVKSVEAASEEERIEIKKSFEKEKAQNFNVENIAIAVNGGLVLFPGLSEEIPLMLVGPYFDSNHLEMEGYVDLQLRSDENGGEFADSNQQFNEEMVSEMFRNLPADIQQQLQSMQDPNEAMNILMEHFMEKENGQQQNGSESNFDAVKKAEELQKSIQNKGQEYMDKHGITFVRQHEHILLDKTADGYEGVYTISNKDIRGSPSGSVKFDDKNARKICLSIKIKCEHLGPSPPLDKSALDEVVTGIDELRLD